jgi:hypothetical protein
MSKVTTQTGMKEKYVKHEKCPDCSERSLRKDPMLFKSRYFCDSCLTTFPTDQYNLDLKEGQEVPIDEAYEEVIAEEGKTRKEIKEEALSDDEEEINLTPKQKSKKNLSRLFYIGALISAFTIVGIPLALVLAVLGAYVSPDTSE